MKTFILTLLLSCLLVVPATTQNVLWGTCEDDSNCIPPPISAYWGTPALPWFDACAGTSPYNFAGYQYAANGDGYTWLRLYDGGGNTNSIRWKIVPGIPAGNPIILEWACTMMDQSKWRAERLGFEFRNTDAGGPTATPDQTLPILVLDTANWINIGMYVPPLPFDLNFVIFSSYGSAAPVLINASGTQDACIIGIDDVKVGISASVQDPRSSPLRVWPNPAEGVLHLPSSSPAFITTMQGVKIHLLQSDREIDLSGLSPGVYLVHQNERCTRFIKN